MTGDVHYLTLLLQKQRTILTIHDFVSLLRLRGVKRWLVYFFWYWWPIKKSRLVTVISNSTKNELLRYVKCDSEKVRVIPDCVSDMFRPDPRKFNREVPRILQIGTAQNKNVERVIDALGGIKCRFVVVGILSEDQWKRIKQAGIECENDVGVSDEKLLRQYQMSDIVIFASTYEGFGLPILEANAVGRAVITSNKSSMPEVAGEAACFVDPFDVESIRSGVQKVMNDAEYRARLIDAGYANVKRFRAAAIAKQYEAIYREIAAKNGTIDLQSRP